MLNRIVILLLMIWLGLLTYSQYKLIEVVRLDTQLLFYHEQDIQNLKMQQYKLRRGPNQPPLVNKIPNVQTQ